MDCVLVLCRRGDLQKEFKPTKWPKTGIMATLIASGKLLYRLGRETGEPEILHDAVS